MARVFGDQVHGMSTVLPLFGVQAAKYCTVSALTDPVVALTGPVVALLGPVIALLGPVIALRFAQDQPAKNIEAPPGHLYRYQEF